MEQPAETSPNQTAAPPPPPTLAGVVMQVVFARGGFGVLKLRADGGEGVCPVVGQVGTARVGERLVLTGAWEVEPKFGRQFKATASRAEVPTTDDGLIACLAELVRGVGPAKARRFVELAGGAAGAVALLDQTNYGEDFPEDADECNDRTRTPSGLAPDEWQRIHAAWLNNAAMHKVEAGLAGFGFSPQLVARLVARYGDEALRVVRERPYDLAHDLDGVGWKRADEVALKAGLPRDTLARKAAALAHALNEDAERDGHVFMPQATARATVQALCGVVVTDGDVAAAAALLAQKRGLVTTGGTGAVGLTRLLEAERRVAAWVTRRLTREPPQRLRNIGEPNAIGAPTDALTGDAETAIAAAESSAGIHLTDEQRSAVRLAHDRSFAVLTGGPGVGKTTVTRTLCALWEAAGCSVGLCAPTGRAARRMAEVTGRSALTIHRLLGFDPNAAGGFAHRASNPLPWDVVVVDEASMVDIELMDALLQACGERTRVLVVGDRDQLPPVGPGAPFRDLVKLGEGEGAAVPVVRLTEVHRQARGSRIIGASREVLEGRAPTPSPVGDRSSGALFVLPESDPVKLARDVVAMVQHAVPQAFGIASADVQVVAPMRKGPLGVVELNRLLREALNPRPEEEVLVLQWTKDEVRSYRVGDKVMQTKNDYARQGRVDGGPEGMVGVVNGELGRVVSVDRTPKARVMLRVAFPEGRGEKVCGYSRADLGNLELAYCTTIHKQQGSQFPAIVAVVHDSHSIMLERALFYTAITRAEKVCFVLGTQRAMQRAAQTSRAGDRRTTLPVLLAEVGA